MLHRHSLNGSRARSGGVLAGQPRSLAVCSRLIQSSMPALAACVMLVASLLPWLTDPLEENYPAWRLPIAMGWQFPAALGVIFNYGLLCLCCAIYIWFRLVRRGSSCLVEAREADGRGGGARVLNTAALLCLAPFALFLLQYLCLDIQGINRLAQHQVQALLISRHFGYNAAPLRIPVNPFMIDSSTIQGRLMLIVQQASPGLLLPCLSACLLLYCKRYARVQPRRAAPSKEGKRRWLFAVGAAFLLVLLGRAPASMFCEHQARDLLSAGSYQAALGWLDAALFLNPSLNQVSYYHIERGQAVYFLHAGEQSDDSRAYLAFAYRKQEDNLSAYQELLAVWQAHPSTPWVVDELSTTLEKLAEFAHPLNGPPVLRPINDDSALPWLQLLVQVDPSSTYARYVIGRIQYDLHNYSMCMAQMTRVIQLSSNTDIQSSAYTYLALSEAGQGNYSEERTLLFEAIELDPSYRNNTAREELSGLH